MKAIIALTSLLASAGFALIQATPLKELLSEEEFAAAGLSKLSAEELATLERLLDEKALEGEEDAIVAEVPPPPTPSVNEDLVGREQIVVDTRKAPKKFESRLIGTFNGWYGSTKFVLENGQVWQQRIDEVQKYTPKENPQVTIYKAIGGYRIRIDGYRQSCAVKRIR